MDVESKVCPDCNRRKPLTEFPRNRSTKTGFGTYCKPCHNIRTRGNRELHGGARNYHLRRRYGITAQQFDSMVVEQGGRCLICGREFTEKLRPVMDHCHDSLAIRGILCDPCNRGLGQFSHDVERVEKAARYLKGGE